MWGAVFPQQPETTTPSLLPPLPPPSPPFLPFLPPSHLLYCLLLFLPAFIPLCIPLSTPPSGLQAVRVFWSKDKQTSASRLPAIPEVTISHSDACATGLYHVHMVQRLLGPTSAPDILFVPGQGGQETHSPCVVLESWFNYEVAPGMVECQYFDIIFGVKLMTNISPNHAGFKNVRFKQCSASGCKPDWLLCQFFF